MNQKDKKLLLDYLRSQFVMSVVTCSKEMWGASIYYLVDDSLNLYFMSNPKTLHAQNIADNPEVVCVITDSDQGMSGDQIGIQLNGECKRVSGIKYVTKLVKMWKKSKLKVGSISIEPFKKAAKAGIYLVKPRKIKFFNTKLYSKEKFKMFEL